MTSFTISGTGIKACINLKGAELFSLRDAGGNELLWQAGEAWKRHAPNLFPIVGRLKGDTLRHNGREYRMTQHGFARDMDFTLVEQSDTSCRFRLRDDSRTHESYPFAFIIEVTYTIRGNDTLSIEYVITNTGDEILPASVGAHPAFRWPLAEGIAKEDHRLAFASDETKPTCRLSDGLLTPPEFPNPVEHRMVKLDETLFAHDAVIFMNPNSRSVVYTAPGAPSIGVAWDEGFRQLGLWSKPDGDFLCIEPWHGTSSPADFDGEITKKPGMMLIPPGDSRKASYTIRLLAG